MTCQIFGHWDHRDYSPFLRCSTPVHIDSFDENSEVSDMQVNLGISNSTSGSISEASPSKDLVVLERNQDKSSLQLSADVPFLPAPVVWV